MRITRPLFASACALAMVIAGVSAGSAAPPAPDLVEPASVPTVASLSEGFDDVSTLPGAGWAITNNSQPVGPQDWFQGNTDYFDAHQGAADAYVGANFNSAGLPAGDISTWLMTPELDLVNGSEFSFWTRAAFHPAIRADRLEVRMSTSGDSTDVGSGPSGVGDFDTLLLSVNPALTVEGYPGEWTQYTATIEGLGAPTTGRLAFRYWVTDGGPLGTNSDNIGIDTVTYEAAEGSPPDPDPAQVIRINGQDRYETATLIAQEFPEGAHTVYVANGLAEFQGVDALVTGAVAGGGPRVPTDGPAPILPVKNDAIPNTVAAALNDLAPQEIVIVGGEVAVGPKVEAELVATGAKVTRIAGGNRFETAAALAQDYPTGGTVYVATGSGTAGADLALADALTSASVAGHHEVPVLLTQTDNLPNVTETALTVLAPDRIVLVGGPIAVNEDVEDALNQIAPTTRLWGPNRYETATALTAEYPADTDRLYVASGTNFPDALVGAALTSSQGQPMLISRPDNLPAKITAEAERLSPQGITIFGGPVAVDNSVKAALQAILNITSTD